MEAFFMIYLEGGQAPTYQHATKEEALKEAKRLSRFTNKKAYILCTIESVEFDAFKIERALPKGFHEDLPF